MILCAQPCSVPVHGMLLVPTAQLGCLQELRFQPDASIDERCRKSQPARKDRRTAVGKLLRGSFS